MFNSSPTRFPNLFAQSIASSQLTSLTGINGQTSVAPIRGCAPVCFRMSISSAAFWIPRKAASTAASGLPAKVTTVLFVLAPGSTFRSETPSTDSIAAVICRITSRSRPSEKFGTHSMILFIAVRLQYLDVSRGDGRREFARHRRRHGRESDKESDADLRGAHLAAE